MCLSCGLIMGWNNGPQPAEFTTAAFILADTAFRFTAFDGTFASTAS
jgi:hypothetical protein